MGKAVVARAVRSDPRWNAVTATLADLRKHRRRAVRIVDADCGCGAMLIAALRHARTLGFTAIEGRGIDRSPLRIGRARAAARRLRDPAIGATFEAGEAASALPIEAEFPADILLLHVPDAVPSECAAGVARVVIADVAVGDRS